MKSDTSRTWALLKPHARPRLRALALVIVLGMITAGAQSSVLVLFGPVVDLVLFPGEKALRCGACAEVLEWDGCPKCGSQTPPVPGPVLGTAEEEAARREKAAAKLEDSGPGAMERAFLRTSDWALEKGIVANPRLAVLYALTILAIVMGLIGAVSQFAFTWLARKVSFQMIVDLRMRLARHLMGLSMRYHNERQFGDLLSRISSDVTTTLVAVNVSLRSMLLEPLFALTALGVAFFQAPLVTLSILVIVPVALLPVRKFTSKVRKGSRKSMTSLGASVQALTQMFQGIRTVKSFGGEERELAQYGEINARYLKLSMKMVRAVALTHAWTALYSVVGVAVLLLVVGVLQVNFALFSSSGSMVIVLMAVARFNNHIKNFTKGLTRVEESVGASVRILEILDEPEDVVEAEDPQPISTMGQGIRFEDVTFTYSGSDEPALQGLRLEVRPGETLALVGPSGAGKSTLVDLVARFIDPTAGRITVDGRDLRLLDKEQWTSLYAMVGQTPFLFHTSIGDNIRYGKPGATQDEVEAAARAADIHEFIMGLPNGYGTDVADMGARLSGGQRQRLTIARAVLKGAPLLLLDEATSSLDSESEAEVQAALDRLMVGHTVIVIAHRLSTIQKADRIAVLENGRLVELGPHDELVQRGGTYARLSSLQNLGTPG